MCKTTLVGVVIVVLSLIVSGVIVWVASCIAFDGPTGPHGAPDMRWDAGHHPGPPPPHHPGGPPPPDGKGPPDADGPHDHGPQGPVAIDSNLNGEAHLDSEELFKGSVISPGYSDEKCVTLTSHSDVETFIKVYGYDFEFTALTSAMSLSIDEGTVSGGDAGDNSCVSFTDTKNIYAGSLADFGKGSHDYRTGISGTPNGDALAPHGKTTYRITLGLPTDTGNSVAGDEASAAFGWEAQE